MNIIDIEDAVNKIQQDIFDSSNGIEYFNLILSTDGYCYVVDFCGIRLWTSDDDDRPFLDESEDERIPIEQHLRELLRRELRKLSRIVV